MLIALAPGCNQVFDLESTTPVVQDADLRPDLDHDQIADEDDPCLASTIDLTGDFDSDLIANADDPCPLDVTVSGASDGDTIPDTCDPFPTLADDHARCMMTFRNPDLNQALWRTRAGDVPWTLEAGLYTPSGVTSTLLASSTIEAPTTTTFEVHALMMLEVPAPPTLGLTLWVRAGEVASSTDVGCELSGGTTSIRLAVVGPGATASQTEGKPFRNGFRLRATVEPGAAPGLPNLRCEAVVFDGSGGKIAVAPVAAAVALPSGSFGFTAQTGSAAASSSLGIYALVTYDRPDAPALP